MFSSVSKLVRIIVRAVVLIFFSAQRVSIPLIPGMRRSSKMMSGTFCCTMANASSPLDAEPITSMPLCVASILARPAWTTGWSSTIRIWMALFSDLFMRAVSFKKHWYMESHACRQGGGYTNPCSFIRQSNNFNRSRNGCGPSFHSAYPKAPFFIVCNIPSTIVFNNHLNGVSGINRNNGDACRHGVTYGIGQCFLSDAEQSVIDTQRNGAGVSGL